MGSRIRGNVDLIKDGKNGFLVEPIDTRGWKRSIIKLIHDDNLRHMFSRKSNIKIEAYSKENVLEELKVIY